MEPDQVSVHQRTEPADAADEGYPLSQPSDTARSEVSDEDRAMFLARHGAEPLLEAGRTPLQIEQLAARYVEVAGDGDVDTFVSWAIARAKLDDMI
jgi:hypothetical protein